MNNTAIQQRPDTFSRVFKCGTYCFLFSIIPIIIYFGSYLFKGTKRLSIAIMLLLNFSVFIALYLRFGNAEPVYDLSPAARLFIVIYSAFAMVFSVIFYNAMYIYTSEHEVTSLEQKNKQLSTDASEDALTSLLNRRGFLPIVDSLMKDESSSKFSVAFCDIDNFKHINDSYGHEAGDEVLKHITLLIRKEMNGSEVCRWGGEEIVILMKDLDIDEAREKMEHLRNSIEVTPTHLQGARGCHQGSRRAYVLRQAARQEHRGIRRSLIHFLQFLEE